MRNAHRGGRAAVFAQRACHCAHGQGQYYLEVPLNAEVRTALDAWLEQRKQRVSQRNEATLFLTKQGTRLATRSIDDFIHHLSAFRGQGVPSTMRLVSITRDRTLRSCVTGNAHARF